MMVVKRSGQREDFEREKLLRGMQVACEKTDVTPARLEAIADEIEAQLQAGSEREILSAEIGALVLRALRAESEVAYIRFASVHQQFQGIQDFAATLDRLKGESQVQYESRDRLGTR